MPAVRKDFLHTNIQYYKISPVHLAAQINRFTDSFLGPELVMGCWESSELLGILDFHFSRNGMCVAGHPEISLDDKRSGNKELTPSPQLSCWHRPGSEGGMQGSTFLAGCSLNPHSESAPPCQTSSNSSLTWESSTCTDAINRTCSGDKWSLLLPKLQTDPGEHCASAPASYKLAISVEK